MTGAAEAARTGVDRVLLAAPRSFCAGVEMAIKALAWMVRIFEPPVYCYHEIIHNRLVVERFRRAGVVFVDAIDDVPPGAPLMLSAHGSAPEVVRPARQRSPVVVDAVCPLVKKVHHEVRQRAKRGQTVVYVGHPTHDEAVGTLAGSLASGESATVQVRLLVDREPPSRTVTQHIRLAAAEADTELAERAVATLVEPAEPPQPISLPGMPVTVVTVFGLVLAARATSARRS